MEPVSLYDMRSIGDAVSPLSEAFFSDQNINVIQQKLKKIVLLEFNPETYNVLLEEINRLGFKPVLLNFRKSSTTSKFT